MKFSKLFYNMNNIKQTAKVRDLIKHPDLDLGARH